MKKIAMFFGAGFFLWAVLSIASVDPKPVAKVAGCDDCGKCRSDQYCCKTANGCVGCFPTSCP